MSTGTPGSPAGTAGRQRTPLADHVADAVALLAAVRRTERIAVGAGAVGRVAAADRRAAVDVPGHDNSQMDGYAVALADLDGPTGTPRAPGTPVTLTLAATIAAGDPPVDHRPGTAAPIMTGAPIPRGADVVIPVEESERGRFDPAGATGTPDTVTGTPGTPDTVTGAPAQSPATVTLRPAGTEAGRYVRRRGSDTHHGDVILREGQVLTPARLAHLSTCGVGEVEVIAPVRAIVLSTGSEVAAPAAGAELAEGATFDANGPGLAAALTAAGADVVHVGSVPDDARKLLEALLRLVTENEAELIVTSGGVSMGAFEVVRHAAQHEGVTLTFTSVAMQPGGPQGIGTLDRAGSDGLPAARIPWLAFPGNPVSALLSCELIARPALGAPARTTLRLPVQLESEETSPKALAQYRRARVMPSGHVRLVGGASSHLIGGFAQADALVLVPVGTGHLRDGDVVETILLPGGER
ncbi:gephyrin-like molybdotransferase Glp [Brachybacterium sp. p3-SID957]|uniref:molybdopterin molybdotransferase MoeA n=1 Tax=Brachybacterium sp. p3-SID957 TaxID=2916049 RepID=UPI00223BB617|nr:gephyrin-like molybdotransferase Glp [Brachybacterium sp. p3-SID957]MCT1775763.1 molybdopterin molybdotransferase MoeA [Brachybacterium sp. p3-SID957]